MGNRSVLVVCTVEAEALYRIAIQPDDQLLTSGRTQSFSDRWIEQMGKAGHEVRIVDAYKPDFLSQLDGCDGFMWWFAHLPSPRNFAKRLLPAVEHGLGIPVFPTWKTVWHFDDKIAQYYLLQAAGVPMPKTWVFWDRAEALGFCRSAQYPLVIKLASGIISENVRLLNNFAEAEYWIKRLFGSGVVALARPNLRHPRTLAKPLREMLRVLRTGQPPAVRGRTDLQRGYLLVQEFLPGNDFDTRVGVIGKRAFAFRRFNRPNDFRASGSGLRDGDPAKIDPDLIRLAFRVAQGLQTQSIAVDGLRREGRHVLTEISYYYEGWILHEECPGHWVLQGDPDTGQLLFVENRVRPEDAILEDFLASLESSSSRSALQL